MPHQNLQVLTAILVAAMPSIAATAPNRILLPVADFDKKPPVLAAHKIPDGGALSPKEIAELISRAQAIVASQVVQASATIGADTSTVTGQKNQTSDPGRTSQAPAPAAAMAAVQADPAAATAAVNRLTCPTDKAGLTDGFQNFSYSLTNDQAATLSFWGKGELSASDKVVLYQFAWYKDLIADDGSIAGRCGSGVMLSLRVSNLQGNLSLTLPTLAATAQLGQSSITYKLGTFGLSGAAIDAAIPNASTVGRFDTDAYAALLQTIAAIQAAYKSPAADFKATPRLIAASYPPQMTVGADLRAVVELLAIRQISKGKSCWDARSYIPNRDQNSDNIVADTYASVAGTSCGYFDGKPNADTRGRAAALLSKYGL